MQYIHDALNNSAVTFKFSFYSLSKAQNPSDLRKMTVDPSHSSEHEDSFQSLEENDPEAGV